MASSLSNPFLFQITIIIAASIYSPLPGLTVPTDNIIWLSFEAVLHSLESQLISWPSRIVQRYMLETSTLNFRIVSYFILVTQYISLQFHTFSSHPLPPLL